MSKTPSLKQGADRLSKVVRDAHERQHELSGSDEGAIAQNPKEAWTRKYQSEGFGPDGSATSTAHMPGAGDTPSAHRQAQFMQELKQKIGENHGKHAQTYGKMAMHKPFSPKAAGKRSIWSRMTRGS